MAAVRAPLLEVDSAGRRRWWNKVLDLGEAKDQLLFSVPMILTNASYYGITLISIMFAGHLGEVQLAGSTLANSWAWVTGLALMVMIKTFSLPACFKACIFFFMAAVYRQSLIDVLTTYLFLCLV